MLITEIVRNVQSWCGCGSVSNKPQRITNALDWITSIVVFILGLLTALGVLPISMPWGYACLGAGVIYVAIMILVSYRSCCSKA